MKKKLTLTIKRPTGEIEVVDVTSKFGAMPAPLFEKIKTETRKAGRGEVLSWDESWEDNRTEAEKAYGEVEKAFSEIERAESAKFYSPERIVKARMNADRVAAEWAAKYPAEATARREARAKAAADRDAEIRSRPGYKAAMEGRD